MNELDEDNDGNIDFYEFVTLMEKTERLRKLDNEREKRRIAKEKEEMKQKEMEQEIYNNKLKSLEEKSNDPLLNAYIDISIGKRMDTFHVKSLNSSFKNWGISRSDFLIKK